MKKLNIARIARSAIAIASASALVFGVAACSSANASSADQVVIYTNADDEAVTAFKNALDNNGYAGKYIIQSFGTSELGGKLMAEGTNIEADMITMSSYYIDSAQKKNNMFADLTDVKSVPLNDTPDYRRDTTSQEGALFYNTEALKAAGLDVPESFKDLADPEYKDQLAVPDIMGSSTAWLMVQAIIAEYGDGDEGKEILTDIYKNAGPHIEQSGSAPIKNVRAGEVAVGFGLRHQAVADKNDGLPMEYVDPTEGNFSLTESVAVIDKGDKTKSDVQKMAATIIDKGRAELQKTYPDPLYEGEEPAANESAYPKTFDQPLTVDLLEQHQKFSEECKTAAEA